MNQTSMTYQASNYNRESLDRILNELRSKNEDIRRRATQELRQTLEAIQRGALPPWVQVSVQDLH